MYTKVCFPRTRYSYNKSLPKFDFQELGMLITNEYQSLLPRIRYAYDKCIPKFDFLE